MAASSAAAPMDDPSPRSSSSSSNQHSNKGVLVLMSSLCIKRDQTQNQQRAISLLEAKGIPYATLDGADPEWKDKRNELFELSGLRGVYPQFFLIHGDDTVSFLGDWEKIVEVNDASALPEEILEAHPNIVTWDKVLGPMTPAT